MQPHSSYKRPQQIVIPLLVIMGLGNALMSPISTTNELGVLLALLWGGVICAQVALISAWIALAAERFAVRIVWAGAVGALLLGMVMLGVVTAAAAHGFDLHEEIAYFAIDSLCSLPLISLAAQTPLWGLRICLRWHIDTADLKSDPAIQRPPAIRDLFVATAAIAIVLGLARLVRASPQSDAPTMMLELLLTAGIVVIVSAITTLPLTMVILGGREPASGCLLLFLAYGIIFIAAAVVFNTMVGLGGAPGELFLYQWGARIVSFLATQVGILFIARNHGVRFSDRLLAVTSSNAPDLNVPKASPRDSGA